MKDSDLSPATRVSLGERSSKLYLRPVGDIPGGLWSWRVYVDGNVHGRGPGSTRKDPVHWYGLLFDGPHRVILRKGSGTELLESNTLEFAVCGHASVVIEVRGSSSVVVLSEAPTAGP